jgi:hypothetical protein
MINRLLATFINIISFLARPFLLIIFLARPCLFEAFEMSIKIPNRRGEILAAEARWPNPLTKLERSCVKLLDEVRSLEWAFGRGGNPASKDITTQAQQSAAILYERGIESKPCDACQKSGTFRKCVTAPEIGPPEEERALFGGACSNCLWNGRGSKCSYHLGKYGFWDAEDNK